MFNISQYLERFKNIGQGEKAQKEAVILAIKEVIGIEIEKNAINFKNGELFLKVSPGIKNAIYIKKDLILKKIKESLDKIILDIR